MTEHRSELEAVRERAREILNRRLHTRTDGYGTHPAFIDKLVDELFPDPVWPPEHHPTGRQGKPSNSD